MHFGRKCLFVFQPLYRIPANLFDNYQGIASVQQEIKFKLAKWIASPLLFNTTLSNYLETNVTEVGILNTAGDEIVMKNLATPIEAKEPYSKKYSYNSDLLTCKAWDTTLNTMSSEG